MARVIGRLLVFLEGWTGVAQCGYYVWVDLWLSGHLVVKVLSIFLTAFHVPGVSGFCQAQSSTVSSGFPGLPGIIQL